METYLSWSLFGAATFAAWLLYATSRYLLSTRRPKNFPPGPPICLGIGNIHQMTSPKPFLQFTEWSNTYGSMVGLKVGPANLIILNDPLHVHEVFCKRGARYSGRGCGFVPRNFVLREDRDRHLLNLSPGPCLRRWRTAANALYDAQGQRQARPTQEATASALAYQLLQGSPEDSLDHVKQWALATPLGAITGQRLENRGKSFSDRFFLAQHIWLQLLGPGEAALVEMLPCLRWLPEKLAGWKEQAKFVRAYMVDEYSSYLQSAKDLGDQEQGVGTYVSRSLLARLLAENDTKQADSRFTDRDIAWLGGSLIDAAVDTTWATIASLILFLAEHHDKQQKAYSEIYRVSPDYPPDISHLEKLPYLRACVLEILRLRPAAPTGLPRLVLEDDVLNGYTIPKGTTILANIWNIQHNPDDYDQPEEFVPERFIHHPLGLKDGVSSDGRMETYAFGAGRRMCTAQKFAETSMMVAMAKIIWAYEIVAVGKLDLDVNTGYHGGLVLGPEAFKVEFQPRDEGKKTGILNDYKRSRNAVGDVKV
jgi:cytochrome P450